jgi:diguanylate cyclase (GGDEF)-like protein
MALLQNILLIFSCIMLFAMAMRTAAKMNAVGSSSLFAMIVFFMVWVFGDLIEVNTFTFQLMLLGRNIQQIGVFFTTLCTLYFSIDYTANEKLRKSADVIACIQAISVVLIFTDQYHHLMRKNVELQTDAVFGNALVVSSTSLGTFLVAFNFCLPLIALTLLVLFSRTISSKLRRPLRLIMLSIFLTVLVAMVQSTLLTSVGIIIPIPVLNVPCVLLLCFAVLRGGFLGLTPTAMNKVFEVIDQGIIVLDGSCRIIEFNRRAAELMNAVTNSDSLQIGSDLSVFLFLSQEKTADAFFSTDNLPAELTDRKRSVFLSLTHHELETSGNNSMGYVLVLTDITMLKERAEIDPLTGIYNREGVTNTFLHYKNDLEANPFLSAMVIDLDSFKNINDTYGHFGGDLILKDLVHTAQALLSGNYAMGRLGGDEFVVLLSAEPEEALFAAERLCQYISERSVSYSNHQIKYTISVGVAGCNVHDSSLTELLHKADLALYQSKQQGKNRVRLYRSEVSILT